MFFYIHLLSVLDLFTPYDLTMMAGLLFGVILMTLQWIIVAEDQTDAEINLIYTGNCCVMGLVGGALNALFSSVEAPIEIYMFFMFIWSLAVNMGANLQFTRISMRRYRSTEFL